ncbi:MAG: hypothetical protein AB7J86_26750 [Vulcanimicrobiota bacterium]
MTGCVFGLLPAGLLDIVDIWRYGPGYLVPPSLAQAGAGLAGGLAVAGFFWWRRQSNPS